MGGQRGRHISFADRTQAVDLIMEAVASGARKHKACEILEISIKTLQRWQSDISGVKKDGRLDALKTPKNKLTSEEKAAIIATAISPEYCDLTPNQIVPRLADQGKYIASEATFYRVLKAANLATFRSKAAPKRHNKPKEYIATAPKQVWSWDITYLPSTIKGMFFYLYLIIDIYSRKIVGYAVHEQETAEYAAATIDEACRSEWIFKPLVLHSDNGSPMKGATMLSMLQQLGVVPSFSRPSVSNDNPFSEAMFKTLKYCPQYPTKPFADLAAAQLWVAEFINWYNNHHCHSGIKFVTPNARHQGLDLELLKNRHNVYALARARMPMRWTGKTRNWDHISAVSLNPGATSKKIVNVN